MRTIENVWTYVAAEASAGGALDVAVETARRTGAALHLVGAIGRSEDRIFQTSFGREIIRIVRADREARLRDLETSARAALAPERVKSTMLEGEVPWHSVVAHAVEHAPDLLVAPANVRGGSGFDSVTQHFFRKCPAAVWAAVPGKRSFPSRVLAAVDPGAAGSDQRLLAREVLELPLRIAAGGPIDLHVANAWTLLGESVIRSRLGQNSAEQFREEQRKAAGADMDELLDESGAKASVAAVHLPNGVPDDAIPALAERLDVDLVVLGTAGRTGLAGFLIGSTAEAIIGRLARSVAVVKPPGFVSPVRSRSSKSEGRR